MMLPRLAILSLIALAEPVFAQSLSGSTKNCERISDSIFFCQTSTSWKRTFAQPGKTAQFVSSYQIDSGIFFSAQIISENLETEDQLSLADARNAIIANTTALASASEASVEFLIDEQRRAFGMPSALLVYTIDRGGVPVLFVNSVVAGSDHVAQLITWRLGSTLRQDDYDAHSDFLNNLRILN